MSRFVSELDKQTKPNDEWVKAEREIEESRKRKADEGRQDDGKSLYEVLQANKAAKQEAFEQKLRLQNQIAALDEDDVEYHQSILDSERAKEAAIRKETSEQLALFRKHQEEAEREALVKSGSPVEEQDTWVVGGKKRKKILEKGSLLGIKLRKSSTSSDHPTSDVNNQSQTVAAGATRSTVEVEKVQDSEISRLKSTPQEKIEPSSTASPRSSPKSSLAELPSTAASSKANTSSIDTTSPSRSATGPSLVLGLDDYSSEDE